LQEQYGTFEVYWNQKWEPKRIEPPESSRLSPKRTPQTIRFKYGALSSSKSNVVPSAAYGRTSRLNPNDALAYNSKGNELYDLKRYEEALAAYAQAIRLNPNNAVFHRNKGHMF